MADYGRGGQAAGTRAPGTAVAPGRAAYSYSAADADKYLKDDERAALAGATAKAGEADTLSNKKKKVNRQVRQRAEAADQVGRLREVAGSRAITDYNNQAMTHSKPWLQTAKDGLIAAQGTAPANDDRSGNTAITSWGAQDMGQALATRGRLSQLANEVGTAGTDRSLIGGRAANKELDRQDKDGQYVTTRQQEGSNSPNARYADQVAYRPREIADYGVTTIADADAAYTGMSGGMTTKYDDDVDTNRKGKKPKLASQDRSFNWRHRTTLAGQLR